MQHDEKEKEKEVKTCLPRFTGLLVLGKASSRHNESRRGHIKINVVYSVLLVTLSPCRRFRREYGRSDPSPAEHWERTPRRRGARPLPRRRRRRPPPPPPPPPLSCLIITFRRPKMATRYHALLLS